MRKRAFILSVLFLGLLWGCGIMGTKEKQAGRKEERASPNRLLGTWRAYYQGNAEIIFEFKPDGTMACTVPDAPDYSFNAKYTVDNSKDPELLDLNMDDGGGCLAIFRFVGEGKMQFFGAFGEKGTLSRPSEFNEYAEFPDVYLEFEKDTE